ncbi:MAG TPA: hypothetical protein VK072_04955 [Candidatus Avamphibacillus sp.]|nr:hypothetical protein [Candidatus Avamphibacillus sp.]
MIFEFIGDILSNSSPLYMYIGILWSMVGAVQLINMDMGRFRKYHRLHIRQTYTFRVERALIQEPIVINKDIRSWLIHKMKRIESPDDDRDDDSFSSFNQIKEIRGGKLWKSRLYSHSLKNIVLSGLF